MKRPSVMGTGVTTPSAGEALKLLGRGLTVGGVTWTRDERRRLDRLYGYEREPAGVRPPRPEPEVGPGMTPHERVRAEERHREALRRWEQWVDPRVFQQAGSDRNMSRHAEHDGLRLVGWLSRYCEAGEDPLKVLVRMAVASGYDVDPSDLGWAEGEDDGVLDEDEVTDAACGGESVSGGLRPSP